MAADGYVSTDGNNPKNVYALVISAIGATIGDKIALRNGGETGTVMLYFDIPAANGLWTIDLGRYGIEFITNVYYSEQATAANKIKTTVIYG
jgi:hypothetical protein